MKRGKTKDEVKGEGNLAFSLGKKRQKTDSNPWLRRFCPRRVYTAQSRPRRPF